jgi:hypothetical protein
MSALLSSASLRETSAPSALKIDAETSEAFAMGSQFILLLIFI